MYAMEDTTLQVIDIRALDVSEGDENVTLVMMVGLATPFAGPDGQPVILPVKIYRVPMSKQASLELIQSLTEETEKLVEPKRPSGLVVPGSPADVDRVAQNLKQFGA